MLNRPDRGSRIGEIRKLYLPLIIHAAVCLAIVSFPPEQACALSAGIINEWGLPNADSRPDGIAAGPDGVLWFTEEGANKIGRAVIDGGPWYMAEGCTAGGFETWVLVQNPNTMPITVDLTLMTDTGPEEPPTLQGVPIPAYSRQSFNVGAYVVDWNVSTRVDSDVGGVVCERALYGNARTWATDSVGFAQIY